MDMDVVGNKERLLKGILDGETTTDIEPAGNEERLLYGILKGENESNIEPASRVERLLKAILENGGGGGTGVVTKTIAGTITNPFSVEEANEIWNAIHGGTGDAHLAFTLPSFGSVTTRFSAEPYEEGVNVLLASITAPVGNQVAALCLMYLVSADTIFLAQKLAYAITPSSVPSVMDASALISNNLDTETSVTEYEQSTLVEPLSVTENGTYTADEGEAFSPVTVNVPQTTVESKSIMANGTYTAESGKAFSPVTVNVPVPALETKSVTANGNYDAPSGKAYNRIEVSVPQTEVEELSVTENGTYTAEEGTAYSPVTVNVPYKTANFEFRNNNAIPAGLFVKCAVPYMNNGNIFTLVSTTKYSGQAQTIVLGESGRTTTTIVTEGWRFTIISGNAAFADNDHLRVNITGDCVLSVEPIPDYKSKAVQIVDRSVTEITAPDLAGITKIGDYAFVNCHSLASITIPSGVTQIDGNAFASCLNLTSITIPSSVTFIGANAFSWCTALKSIVIPSGVTYINGSVFTNCTALESVTLHSNITSIGSSAFNNCTSLESIIIPSGITAIQARAFKGCSSLSGVTIEATTPPTLGSNAFDGCHADLVIYVPSASVATYQAATGWSDYASKIQAIPNS